MHVMVLTNTGGVRPEASGMGECNTRCDKHTTTRQPVQQRNANNTSIQTTSQQALPHRMDRTLLVLIPSDTLACV